MRIVWRALINAIAIAVAAYFVPGITWGNATYGFGEADKYISLLLTGLVLGVVNAFIRPIISLIAMPITCLTLGLFHFVIGALMLLLVSAIPGLGFQVNGLVAAFLGAIIISIVGLVLSWILPD
ncbi:MAG TPA: phage holin family protein [Candidatus Limnocylindria bacterium]|jgi:putative membrane protein|nr:phage holin family protein [Candidatus Limnocylindria bacterium]